eukprot:scaffold3513_cov127-Isochrysis_galbana.AAC.1
MRCDDDDEMCVCVCVCVCGVMNDERPAGLSGAGAAAAVCGGAVRCIFAGSIKGQGGGRGGRGGGTCALAHASFTGALTHSQPLSSALDQRQQGAGARGQGLCRYAYIGAPPPAAGPSLSLCAV